MDQLFNTHKYEHQLIFNIDETSVYPSHKHSVKVAQVDGSPQAVQVTPPRMPNCTLLFTISAFGTYLRPQLIIPHRTVPDDLLVLEGSGIDVHANGSGWMNKMTFEAILLTKIFPEMIRIRQALRKPEKYIMVILDGHPSRKSLPILEYAMKNNITILTIPAHTRHLIAPLDLTCNAVFKHRCRAVEAKVRRDMNVPHLTPALYMKMLPEILPKCVLTAMRDNIIRSGWERAGICHGNRENVIKRLHKRDSPVHPKRGLNISGKVFTTQEMINELKINQNKNNLVTETPKRESKPTQKKAHSRKLLKQHKSEVAQSSSSLLPDNTSNPIGTPQKSQKYCSRLLSNPHISYPLHRDIFPIEDDEQISSDNSDSSTDSEPSSSSELSEGTDSLDIENILKSVDPRLLNSPPSGERPPVISRRTKYGNVLPQTTDFDALMSPQKETAIEEPEPKRLPENISTEVHSEECTKNKRTKNMKYGRN